MKWINIANILYTQHILFHSQIDIKINPVSLQYISIKKYKFYKNIF